MKTVITGATGLIGRSLVRSTGQPTVLSRDPERARSVLGSGPEILRWAPDKELPPSEAFEQADTIFHLAGESIGDRRWTGKKRVQIRESRVAGTRNLVTALAGLNHKPQVLVSASAVGCYGDQGDRELTETAPIAETYLARVCADWESEALKAADLGIRVVVARMGIVLSRSGGALGRMLPAFRLGVGGPLGHGRQWMPWIHIEDAIGLLLHGANTRSITGPVNVVGPNPETNREFTRQLAASLHRPAWVPIPRILLRLLFGELSQVLVESQRAVPSVAQSTGYQFQYSELSAALEAVLKPGGQDRNH